MVRLPTHRRKALLHPAGVDERVPGTHSCPGRDDCGVGIGPEPFPILSPQRRPASAMLEIGLHDQRHLAPGVGGHCWLQLTRSKISTSVSLASANGTMTSDSASPPTISHLRPAAGSGRRRRASEAGSAPAPVGTNARRPAARSGSPCRTRPRRPARPGGRAARPGRGGWCRGARGRAPPARPPGHAARRSTRAGPSRSPARRLAAAADARSQVGPGRAAAGPAAVHRRQRGLPAQLPGPVPRGVDPRSESPAGRLIR